MSNHKNIIEELYHGNISPYAKCFDRDSNYAKHMETVVDSEEKLAEILNAVTAAENRRDSLADLINAQSEILSIHDIERFIEGFRLGARFMLDTFLVTHDREIKDIR